MSSILSPHLPLVTANTSSSVGIRSPLSAPLDAFELRARVESLEFFERQLRDFALAVGGALDGFVMNHDDGAVAAELNVQLAHDRTRVDSGAKSAQGVLGKSTARPAMGYVQHSPPPPRWKNRSLIMMRVYALIERRRKPVRLRL